MFIYSALISGRTEQGHTRPLCFYWLPCVCSCVVWGSDVGQSQALVVLLRQRRAEETGIIINELLLCVCVQLQEPGHGARGPHAEVPPSTPNRGDWENGCQATSTTDWGRGNWDRATKIRGNLSGCVCVFVCFVSVTRGNRKKRLLCDREGAGRRF